MNTRKIKYKIDKLNNQYYFDGWTIAQFSEGPHKLAMYSLLQEINEQPLKSGFNWVNSYQKTMDLYPGAYLYSSIFLDFLFEQKIPQLIERCVGNTLVLGDLTIRKTLNSKNYMTWHRDTVKYRRSDPIGRTPPLHKLILYPQNSLLESRDQFSLIPGSQLRVTQSKALDGIQARIMGHISVGTSSTHGVLFNSAALHCARPNRQPNAAHRVIFNFCTPNQLSQFAGREDLHQMYWDRLSST